MAMGSGAFLVQTCRYLAERLVEAWENAEKANPGKIVTAPDGTLSKSLPDECVIPKDASERLTVARRIIADRCLYGVDKNPLAVEMAKLSLWLITLQKNRPFTFVDHALKCGDSLIGASIEQLRHWNLDITGTPEIFAEEIRREINQVIELRQEIASLPVLTTEDQNRKAYLLAQANARSFDLRRGCDLLVGSYFNNWTEKEREGLRKTLLTAFREGADIPDGMGKALPDLEKLRAFHWELEFPEVFVDNTQTSDLSGFNAIVGNPPFMGGLKLHTQFGENYRDFLINQIANGVRGVRGTADLCAYFFLRAYKLIRYNANFGLIATNTIAQGDTREIGLDQIVANNTIYRAVSSRRWVGSANLEIACVFLRKGDWKGLFILDAKLVNGITSLLTVKNQISGNPYALKANQNKAFQGSIVLGMGFIIDDEEAHKLISQNSRNRDVIFPYLSGQDLNSRVDQSPSRWVINFFDWCLDVNHEDPKNPKGSPYAVDYPDCISILEERVKPERENLPPINSYNKSAAQRWWQFAGYRIALDSAIASMSNVIAVAATSRTLAFAFIPTGTVFANTLYILAFNRLSNFTILQSCFHDYWVRQYSSSMKGDLRYTSDVFSTFPFPISTTNLEEIGAQYYTHRQNIMQTNQEGLTKTYNRFHNPAQSRLYK